MQGINNFFFRNFFIAKTIITWKQTKQKHNNQRNNTW